MVEEGLHLDVAGGGEILSALKAGADPGRLVLHGNAKTDEELELAVEHGVGLVVVDNFDDIDRLERIVPRGYAAAVPGPGHPRRRGRHPRVAGHRPRRVQVRPACPTTPGGRSRASSAARCCAWTACTPTSARSCSTSNSWPPPSSRSPRLGTFDTYDLGGGLGVRYTYDEQPPTLDEYADAMVAQARALLPDGSRIIVEPGRSMVATAACTVYRVTTVKRGDVIHVAVDGGMGDNLEVSLTGQRFEATIVDRVGGGGETVTVVGRHCESGDQLVDGVALRDPRVGDLLAVPVTGAYCYTMSNQYNGARRVPVVFARDGKARLVVRRDTWDDLLGRDVG